MLLFSESTARPRHRHHPDDIELGAGGFVHRLGSRVGCHVDFLILMRGSSPAGPGRKYKPGRRVEEAQQAAAKLGVPVEQVEVLPFFDSRLHEAGHDLIGEIEQRLFDSALHPATTWY